MRSYLDILKDYMKDKGFMEIQENWYNCLVKNSAFNSNRFQFLQAYPSFNQMNHFYILQDLLTREQKVDFYKANKNGRLSKVYGQFIRALEKKEDLLLKEMLGKKSQDWFHFKKHRTQNPKRLSFKLEDIFIEWLDIQKINDDRLFSYFAKRKESKIGSRIVEAINNFYNPWSRLKGIPTYQNSEIEIENLSKNGRDIEIDFHSSGMYDHGNDCWSDKELDSHANFFIHSDVDLLEPLNQRSQTAAVSVKARLKNLHVLPVQPTQWFDEELLSEILCDNRTLGHEILSEEEFNYFSSLFNHRTQELYLINGFEVCIESLANYSEIDFEILKTNNVRIFPFYFDDNLDFNTEITQMGDGSLKILLSSTSEVPIIIGCGIKKLSNR